MRVGWFHLDNADESAPLPAAGCLDVAGADAAGRSPWSLLRVYEDKVRPEPTLYAQKIKTWAASRPAAVYQLANETNLDSEHFGGGPADYATWAERVCALLPAGVRVGVGAFSPGDIIPGVRTYADTAGWDALDGLCGANPDVVAVLHVYAPDLAGLKASFLRQAGRLMQHTPIVVGEVNFGPGATVHVDRDRWADDALRPFLDWLATEWTEVQALLYFARRWPDPEPWFKGGTPVDGTGTAIERVLREWRAPVVPVTPLPAPGPVPAPVVPPAPTKPPVKPPPAGGTPVADLRGVDISNNQGDVDLAAVKAAGYAFAIFKASGDEGGGDNRFFDSFFPVNWAEAGRLEMPRGAYHYARPSVATPAQSVTLFAASLEAVGGLRPGDLIALDLEDPAVPVGTSLHDWAREWLEEVERELGVVPFLYTGQYYIDEHGIGPGLGRFPLWLASYQATRPPTPAGWDRITIWQNDVTAADVVPGVRGRCDVNVFLGTVDELRAFGKKAEESGVFDVTAAYDRLWAEADTVEANGYPWLGQGIKAMVAASKGER